MKKDNTQKQKRHDIQSIQLRANTGDPIVLPCKLNVVKKKKAKPVNADKTNNNQKT